MERAVEKYARVQTRAYMLLSVIIHPKKMLRLLAPRVGGHASAARPPWSSCASRLTTITAHATTITCSASAWGGGTISRCARPLCSRPIPVAALALQQALPWHDPVACLKVAAFRVASEPAAALSVADEHVAGFNGGKEEATSAEEPPPEGEAPSSAVGEVPAGDAASQRNSTLRFVWRFVDGALVLWGCLFTLASVVVAVLIPTRSAALLKAAARGALTARGVLEVMALVNSQALLKVIGSYCLLRAGEKLRRQLRHLIFSSVLAQELEWVATSRPAALVAQLAQDTEDVAKTISSSLGTALHATATVVGSIVQLALISYACAGESARIARGGLF